MSIRQVDEGLWCLDSSFKVLGAKGSARMSIVWVGDGVLIYSPVALSQQDLDAIADIGPVRAIIAPNTMHYLYFRQALQAFPDATAWIADGVVLKIGSVEGAKTLKDATPIASNEYLEQVTFEGHDIQETVLYHKASKTLITCDLLYNIQSEQSFSERMFFRLIRAYGAPKVAFYHKSYVKDKEAMQHAIDTVCAWDIRRIVMSHGRIIEDENVAEIFRDAWAAII
ncbi:hypothetical protein GCM10017044_18100 [Kordiimonas sediminis]|uniref:DUF4336 domain-containing protein n=1 Tax=Kordiimonas sediminis TaxID=1735581 RepID=A0A919E7Z2_9PROT|nr:DUF4336 domain-containing protein [Kordiimonas sediminis]GHF23912.1 hypothetical protein GCM10017044_18100 [Kordiimonas sediminis]